jgi:hypothetical protein
MKNTSIIALLTLCFPVTQAFGDLIGNGIKLVGALKVLKSVSGTTTVTPAYDIHDYRNRQVLIYGGSRQDLYRLMSRDLAGVYHYYTRTLQPDGTYQQTRDVFPIVELKRLNYNCVLLPGLFEYTELGDFTMVMWADKVAKSGLFPPGEPYSGWLKSVASRVADTCAPAPDVRFETYAGGPIYDTGRTTCKFIYLPYTYTFPMTCWIGNMWDY